MTTVPLPTTSSSGAAPRPTPMGSGAPVSSVDPIKLLSKHKWGLVAATIIGAALGVGAHFVLARLTPVYKPTAQFRCYPPKSSVIETQGFTNMDEMRQFMQTQVYIMTSDLVLDRLARKPELPSQAPKWALSVSQRNKDSGEMTPVLNLMLDSLRDHARARVLPQTALIELSFSWKDKDDATSILRLLKETYQQVVDDSSKNIGRQSVQALRDKIKRLDDEVAASQARRAELIAKNMVGGSVNRGDSEAMKLQLINQDLIDRTNQLNGIKQQMMALQERSNSAEGSRYSDQQRQDAERDPQVIDARARLHAAEGARQALLDQRYSPEHHEVRRLDSAVAASQVVLDTAIRGALDRIFRADQDKLSLIQRELEAQISQMSTQAEALSQRLTELNAINVQIEDLLQKINYLQQDRTQANGELQSLMALANIDISQRVVLNQSEMAPNEMSFPRLSILIPAGALLSLLLVGGTMLVRELVDQRIKSPADIGIIPRTRLLGWVPDAAEDPQSAGAVETTFRDRPRGVVAESFRQLRSAMDKRLRQAGHRTVVVLSGLPSSGATSVASNLALAAAAADQRVLLIDANYRRPSVHRVFGAQEAPGLADALAKQIDLDAAIQHTSTPTLDLLAAGTRDARVVERLSADGMLELLSQVRNLYDLVLIDVAPAIVAGDGIALANRCDASILVVKAFGEKRGMIARIKNDLSDSRGEFLGVVVNAVRASTGGYLKGNIRAAAEYRKE